MRAAAIDIGTNSVRLLIGDGRSDVARRTVVTGLGKGMGGTGRLSEAGSAATLEVLASYRDDMDRAGVERARAVMTAVGRNASDTGGFLDDAASALGLRPEVISGEEEAALSYRGAVADLSAGEWTVVDIGGGSTEVVGPASAVSHEIGSVALTDRCLEERPVSDADLAEARRLAAAAVDTHPAPDGVVGVAGTWTSLAAMSQQLDPYDSERVHHFRLSRPAIRDWVDRLRDMSLADTARLPGLDPARAPVILGGSVVAETVLTALAADECLVSERDLLDGVLASLM